MRTTVSLLLAIAVAACDAPDRTTAPNVTPAAPDRDFGVISTGPAGIVGYRLVDISGGYTGGATDVNDSGWVVGTHTVPAGVHGFVRHADGTIEDVAPLPGDVRTTVTGINNANQIVGTSTSASGQTHPWRRLPGRALEQLGDVDCKGNGHANAIDDDGEIVGACDMAPTEWHVESASRWSDRSIVGDVYDVAAGALVGMVYNQPVPYRAFMWNGGTPDALPMPAGTVHSHVYGVNDTHLIVGDYEVGGYPDPKGGLKITSVGGFYGTPIWVQKLPHAAYGVSAKGRIVGWYVGIPAVAYTIAPNGSNVESALPPSGVNRVAVRVNTCGTIVGHYFPAGLAGGARAAIWTKSTCD